MHTAIFVLCAAGNPTRHSRESAPTLFGFDSRPCSAIIPTKTPGPGFHGTGGYPGRSWRDYHDGQPAGSASST